MRAFLVIIDKLIDSRCICVQYRAIISVNCNFKINILAERLHDSVKKALCLGYQRFII
jgi:hypothetical protein